VAYEDIYLLLVHILRFRWPLRGNHPEKKRRLR